MPKKENEKTTGTRSLENKVTTRDNNKESTGMSENKATTEKTIQRSSKNNTKTAIESKEMHDKAIIEKDATLNNEATMKKDIVSKESKTESNKNSPDTKTESIKSSPDTNKSVADTKPKASSVEITEKRSIREQKMNHKKETESKKSQIIRFAVLLVLVAAVVLAVYVRLTNQSKNSNQQAEENMTEVNGLIQYDLEKSYPKTARDVVKLHCRFLKSIYNESLEESDIQALNTQTRQLYAQELLGENPESKQFSDLVYEVEDFQNAGKIYISYTVDAEENVQYSEIDGAEYATVYVTCMMKENGETNTVREQYLLIKENEQWKILGWQGMLLDSTTTEE